MTRALLFVAAVLLSVPLFAAGARESAALLKMTCGNSVAVDANAVYMSAGLYGTTKAGPRPKTSGRVFVSPLEPSLPMRRFNTLDGAVDLEIDGQTLWVLTYTAIEEWDLASGERKGVYPTTLDGRPPTARLTHALGFARAGTELVIAHGRFGVSIFDTVAKKVVHEEDLLARQAPLESVAMDVAVKDGVAVLVFDSFTLVERGAKPAFEGAVLYDVKAREVLRELAILNPGVQTVNIRGDEVLVGWGTPFWVFPWKGLLTDRKPKPLRRISDFKTMGYPKGKPYFDETSMMTCFLEFQASGYGRVEPRVLDRKALGL